MTSDQYGRLWPARYELCDECGQPDNCGDCTHGRLTAANVIELGGTLTSRYDLLQEFQIKSDNVRKAHEEGLLDAEERESMIDRFRRECEAKVGALQEVRS